MSLKKKKKRFLGCFFGGLFLVLSKTICKNYMLLMCETENVKMEKKGNGWVLQYIFFFLLSKYNNRALAFLVSEECAGSAKILSILLF